MKDAREPTREFRRDPPYRILGVSLIGPPPVGTVHLEWRPGLTVLYGLNGAGKSAILGGLVNVLRGRASPGGTGILHIEVAGPEDEIEWVEGTYPTMFVESTGEYAGEVAKHLALGQSGEQLEYSWAAPTFAAEIRQMLEIIAVRYKQDLAQMADEIAPQGMLSLVAVGDRKPTYRMFASGIESEDTPALTETLAAIVKRRESRDSFAKRRIGFPKRIGPVGWDPHIAAELLREPRPAWVPVPLVEIGRFEDRVAGVFVGDEGDADRETHELLVDLSKKSPALLGVPAPTGTPSNSGPPILHDIAVELSHRASEAAAELLEDAPVLSLEPHAPTDWINGRYAHWEALDLPSETMVPLTALSRAQARWASVAIELATRSLDADLTPLDTGYEEYDDWHFPTAVVIDEPEQALHGRAVDRVFDGLAAIARRDQSPVLVATHAAASLDAGRARLVHVDRSSGMARLNELATPLVETLGGVTVELGVRPSDLLQLTSVFLLVEGAKDEVVLQATIGDELASLRARLVPMRGSRSLVGVVDSQFIFEYTSASVVVCLDRVRTDRVNSVRAEALELFEAGKVKAALNRLDRAAERDAGSREEGDAYRFLRRAMETRDHHRVTIFGLSAPDIIYYLPVTSFRPDAESWDQVQAEYMAGRNRGEKIYDWMRRIHNVNTSVAAFKRAAGELDHIPTEFADLLEQVEMAASR